MLYQPPALRKISVLSDRALLRIQACCCRKCVRWQIPTEPAALLRGLHPPPSGPSETLDNPKRTVWSQLLSWTRSAPGSQPARPVVAPPQHVPTELARAPSQEAYSYNPAGPQMDRTICKPPSTVRPWSMREGSSTSLHLLSILVHLQMPRVDVSDAKDNLSFCHCCCCKCMWLIILFRYHGLHHSPLVHRVLAC